MIFLKEMDILIISTPTKISEQILPKLIGKVPILVDKLLELQIYKMRQLIDKVKNTKLFRWI